MNEFENNLVQSVMQGLHDFEIKMAETIGEIRGDLKSLTKAVNNSVAVDTKRLDAACSRVRRTPRPYHQTRRLEKNNASKRKNAAIKRLGTALRYPGTIAVIVAVILAYLLTKL